MSIVIHSNEYWGKRYGTYSEHKPKNCSLAWSFFIWVSKFGSKSSNSGKTINKPQSLQSKRDKERFMLQKERPVLYYNSRGKRNANPI